MNGDKERKAPEIKPDYATMQRRFDAPKPRPWLAVILFAVCIAIIWAVAYALQADLPAWMDAPIFFTGFALGAGAFIGGIASLVGW